MFLRRLFAILAVLMLTLASAGAQSISTQKGDSGNRGVVRGSSGSVSKSERDKMISNSFEVNTSKMDYKKYEDAKLKDLEKRMEERDWESEGTAWTRACKTNTKEAYQKYIAIYPNGAHRAEANSRLIDLEVNEIFNHSHNDLPEMERVEEDDNSPTSTVWVENHTDQLMTVRYSGVESKMLVISPRGRGAITLKNGTYRIGASVQDKEVRPFAGIQDLMGGTYKTGYMIVVVYN